MGEDNKLTKLLKKAVEKRASDIHFSAGIAPSCRIDGKLCAMTEEKIMPEEINELAKILMNEKQWSVLNSKGEVDFAYSLPVVGRFRANVFHQRGTIAMSLRILNLKIPYPEELNLPKLVIDMTKKRRGLVLVTGITGSGKSTTLASLVNLINENYAYHIITLEDPIEYLHRHKKSIVNQREMGMDSQNYASALRAALRQDPDVILVGEMRDLETISVAVTAAETGHLVFSTLHTIGAANTIDRIIDVFPTYQQQQIRTQLADVLQCVVSQQLLPKKDGNGRIGAFETMAVNGAIRNMIRESKTFQIQTVMQTSRGLGMQTMDDAIYDLCVADIVDQNEGIGYAQDTEALRKRLGR
ncbi:MAG TPA: type IV pili twitching motility protein PilT [Lachnospiraceae bacterium]|nr:type IV pili twitching motility protein PilT [Lachnospiraceae bacterium]